MSPLCNFTSQYIDITIKNQDVQFMSGISIPWQIVDISLIQVPLS